MNRPERQSAHLIEKLATKQARIPEGRKPGKRVKRWKLLAKKFGAAS